MSSLLRHTCQVSIMTAATEGNPVLDFCLIRVLLVPALVSCHGDTQLCFCCGPPSVLCACLCTLTFITHVWDTRGPSEPTETGYQCLHFVCVGAFFPFFRSKIHCWTRFLNLFQHPLTFCFSLNSLHQPIQV